MGSCLSHLWRTHGEEAALALRPPSAPPSPPHTNADDGWLYALLHADEVLRTIELHPFPSIQGVRPLWCAIGWRNLTQTLLCKLHLRRILGEDWRPNIPAAQLFLRGWLALQ